MITEDEATLKLDAIASGSDRNDGISIQGLGVFGQVVAGLRGSGFSPIAIWSIVKLILELIEEYSDDVQKIIERIKELFGKK